MIHLLKQLENDLPKLIKQNVWKSLKITYEEPHVHRLWTPVLNDTHRLCIHKIFKCKTKDSKPTIQTEVRDALNGTIDPFDQWVDHNLDFIHQHPNSFIALHLKQAKVIKVTTLALEIGAFSTNLTDNERGEVMIFHTSTINRSPPKRQPLYHPHDWESAVKIINGIYEMTIGTENEIFSTIELHSGSYYEMLNYKTYHSVNPKTDYVLSLMLMGKLYENRLPFPKPSEKQEKLTAYEQALLFSELNASL